MKTAMSMMVLMGLRSAWRRWDYDDFMNNFFINRFPRYKERKNEHGHYKLEGYALEKWRKFTDNPVAYMCHMDDDTLSAFAKAIRKEYKRKS